MYCQITKQESCAIAKDDRDSCEWMNVLVPFTCVVPDKIQRAIKWLSVCVYVSLSTVAYC